VDGITARCWLLGEHPDAGRYSGDIAPGARCFPNGRYLIYYRPTLRGTDFLHIFHGAQGRKVAIRKPAQR